MAANRQLHLASHCQLEEDVEPDVNDTSGEKHGNDEAEPLIGLCVIKTTEAT